MLQVNGTARDIKGVKSVMEDEKQKALSNSYEQILEAREMLQALLICMENDSPARRVDMPMALSGAINILDKGITQLEDVV